MFGGNLGWQSPQQSAATHDPLESQERVFQVQLQTQIGRQDEPPRHFFFVAGRGHLLGQSVQHPLLKAELKKLLLVGLADNLDLIELAATESFQHLLGVVLDEA